MIPRIDTYSLRLFVCTADEGSIARAAAREHIAPSALSRRIADLEHAFGDALLVRSPHGIELTESGRLVYERGLRFEHELEQLVREVRDRSGDIAGTVRLHANASAVIGFLPERLKAFRTAHPQVAIELREAMSSEVVRACLDDVADVGVGAIEQVPLGLDSWRFADDPLMVVLPTSHPLAERPSIRLHEVVEHPLVSVQPGGALDRLIEARVAAAGLARHVSVTVNGFDAVCRMVEAGLGIAIVPRSAAAAYAGSHRFERRTLDEPWIGRELRLYALRKSPRLKVVTALLDALKG